MTYTKYDFDPHGGRIPKTIGGKEHEKLPMKAPRVSIVLPTYNGRKHLRQAIESCLSQSFEDLELIVVIDGSTDDSEEIISDYVTADARVRLLSNSTNMGLPRSLNGGFRKARGEFLTWTSDDNYYRHNAIETMIMYLRDHPNADLVFAQMSQIDDFGRELGPKKVGPVSALLTGNPFGACFLYRRSVYCDLGDYDADWELVEDYEYWLRAAARGHRIDILGDDLYCYRLANESLTSRRGEEILYRTIDLLVSTLPDARWARKWDRAAGWFSLARRAHWAGRTDLSREALIRSILMNPLCLVFAAQRLALQISKRVTRTERRSTGDDSPDSSDQTVVGT